MDPPANAPNGGGVNPSNRKHHRIPSRFVTATDFERFAAIVFGVFSADLMR
jgi:hypothetical protein